MWSSYIQKLRVSNREVFPKPDREKKGLTPWIGDRPTLPVLAMKYDYSS
jgi:hypothetical protein